MLETYTILLTGATSINLIEKIKTLTCGIFNNI